MAEGVYKIVEVVGVSEKSWEDAVGTPSKPRPARCVTCGAEVTKLDMKVENGKIAAFRTRLALSFKYEA